GRPKRLHANDLEAKGPQAGKQNAAMAGEDPHPDRRPAGDPREGHPASGSPRASEPSANDLSASDSADDLHDSAGGPPAEAGHLPQPSARPPLFAALLTRGLLLALAWCLLSEGQWPALWI